MNKEIEVLGAFFDGDRSPEVFQQLEEWIQERPENVALFVEHMLVNNDIGRYVLAEDLSRFEQLDFATLQSKRSESPRRTQISDRRPKGNPVFATAFALAASLLLVVGVSMLPSTPEGAGVAQIESSSIAPPQDVPSSADLKSNEVPSPIDFVATISDSENCEWEDDSLNLTYGRELPSGTSLRLKLGLAQLTFETGAVVIIEGPSCLVVRENAIDLDVGRISATVPSNASGFAVATPNSEVIDLGTEFGINVDEAGDTEVHVFKGEVISRPTDSLGQPAGEFVRLTKNSAIAFRSGSEQAEAFAADEAAFVRRLRELQPQDGTFNAPVEGKLLLWLAGDKGVYQDEQGAVVAWLDTLTEDTNRIADNALQPEAERRPLLVETAIGNMPAVRFDGKNDCLTTTPMTNGDSQTIAFVAALDDATNFKGNLINYNGPPQIVGLGDPSVAIKNKLSILQIRVCRIQESSFPLIDPYVYAGHWKGSDLFVGRMEHQSRASSSAKKGPFFEEPFIAIYVYDKERNRAELFINGESYGRSTAPVSAAITSRKVIARHGHWPDYFHGDLAELIIYDEGLQDDQLARLSHYFSEKYSIGETAQ